MLGWNEILQKYITKYSNQIQKVTEPLRTSFGISYFTYHHIDHSGKYTVLVDRPDWAEHYIGEKIYLNDPYLRDPKNYNPGLCLVDSQGSKAYKETLMRAGKKVINADIGVILVQQTTEWVEFFGFAGTKETCVLERLYLNDRHLLTSFGVHFKTLLNPILTKMYTEAGSLLDLKGKDFLTFDPVQPTIPSYTRHQYLKAIGMKRELKVANLLSQRERQCLQFLLQDKTSKETAALLELSSRTVESYFENIKVKFNCWNKQAVLQMAKKLQAMGLL